MRMSVGKAILLDCLEAISIVHAGEWPFLKTTEFGDTIQEIQSV